MKLRTLARAAALAVLLGVTLAAQAQLRSFPIPPNTKVGEIHHVTAMIVEIDGQRMQLAPGALIHDPNNRLVLPTAIPPGAIVKYKIDVQGEVSDVWILSPQEAAQAEAQKRNWSAPNSETHR
jgi:hypothetical protein